MAPPPPDMQKDSAISGRPAVPRVTLYVNGAVEEGPACPPETSSLTSSFADMETVQDQQKLGFISIGFIFWSFVVSLIGLFLF